MQVTAVRLGFVGAGHVATMKPEVEKLDTSTKMSLSFTLPPSSSPIGSSGPLSFPATTTSPTDPQSKVIGRMVFGSDEATPRGTPATPNAASAVPVIHRRSIGTSFGLLARLLVSSVIRGGV